ncbi:shikimate dehydrogenase family protein [Vreelandella olivaria]|uniref:shikimate dehydrogenase family protein n=1 Tax=Vreelandella olivaria TaxID=390919 RepID=UPI00201F793D|nr:hypothetical protein [Halomonas olivaria]
MLNQLDGSTRLYLILGDPIAQVKSPQGVTAAFQERGHNAILAPVHISADHLAEFATTASLARNVDGLIITVPHKFAARDLCARLTPRAEFLGAVNVMRRDTAGQWYGDQVDGLAYVAALKKRGVDPKGQQALLAGAGGAGSAIAEALLHAGASSLAIHDSDHVRRDRLIRQLSELQKGAVVAGSSATSSYSLVINATPAGMQPDDPQPFDPQGLQSTTIVGDVITLPETTPWLAGAQERGCTIVRGVDMFAQVRELMVDFLLEQTP